MTKKEFEQIVGDAVAAGATREDAEAYVRSGFKVDEDAEGAESLGGSAPKKKAAPKKNAAPKKKAKK